MKNKKISGVIKDEYLNVNLTVELAIELEKILKSVMLENNKIKSVG